MIGGPRYIVMSRSVRVVIKERRCLFGRGVLNPAHGNVKDGRLPLR